MTGNRGVTMFVLLLSCWHEANLHPVRIFSGPSTVLPPNLRILDDDVAGVFDEILVQEILDPSNSSLLVTQRLLSKSRTLKKENTHTDKGFKTDINEKYHEKELSSENKDVSSLNEEEKETFYQIKSLAALEKIIDSLRRALGCHLEVDAVADLRKDSLPSRAQVHRAISQVLGQVSPQTYVTQDQEPIEDWFVLARRARHAIF